MSADGAAPELAQGEVLAHDKVGAHYHSLTIVVPSIGERIATDQFLSLWFGPHRSYLLRKPFSVYRAQRRGGWASTVEVVFDIRGAGTGELATLAMHDKIDVMGPLGNGFPLPRRHARCLLVGGGIGAAPLYFLIERLRAEGHRVDVILGARDASLLLNAIDARRLASVCRITTEDGSAGDRGVVTDVLEDTIARCGTEVVYACGPQPMLAAVSRLCSDAGIPVQVAVEELMACGYGVCMTCVVPVRARARGGGPEGVLHARTCTEGPVFDGARIMWDVGGEDLAVDQRELTPAGLGVRGGAPLEGPGEHAPPGN